MRVLFGRIMEQSGILKFLGIRVFSYKLTLQWWLLSGTAEAFLKLDMAVGNLVAPPSGFDWPCERGEELLYIVSVTRSSLRLRWRERRAVSEDAFHRQPWYWQECVVETTQWCASSR